jgi:DNA-binding protein H-NS
VILLVVQNQPHSPLADLSRKLVRCLAHRRSILSGVGAADNPGAVQVPELVNIRDAIEHKRLEHLEEAKNAVLEEMRGKLAELGLILEEALPQSGRKSRSDAGRPLPVRYRSPTGETWSGRGYPPRWVTQLESEGRNREEFRVTES